MFRMLWANNRRSEHSHRADGGFTLSLSCLPVSSIDRHIDIGCQRPTVRLYAASAWDKNMIITNNDTLARTIISFVCFVDAARCMNHCKRMSQTKLTTHHGYVGWSSLVASRLSPFNIISHMKHAEAGFHSNTTGSDMRRRQLNQSGLLNTLLRR